MLKLGQNLELPLSAVTQTFAFLGKRGGGKSYSATKLCELMLSEGAQIIALDPVGVWYGLRVPRAENQKAFEIVVCGGLNGDIEITPKAGKIIAEIIVEKNIPAVVDISQFVQSEQTRFAYDFLTTVFEMKKRSPSPVHIFLEEAQEIVPQNVIKGDAFAARMLNSGERLVKLGRNFGIGCSLISQRPQEVNKKVLNQTEVMLAFQMTGLQERKTIAEWTRDKGSREERVSNLPSLEIGEALVWSPSWLKFDGRVKILQKLTADVSATPQLGDAPRDAGTIESVDVAELRAAIGALIEETEAENPKHLKKQIADLQKEISLLKKNQPAAEIVNFPDKEFIEAKLYFEDVRAWANNFRDELTKFSGDLDQRLALLADLNRELHEKLPKVPAAAYLQIPGQPTSQAKPQSRQTTAAKSVNASASGLSLPTGEKQILIAVAQNPDGASREQLTILTGYKRSSRDAYLQRLRGRGFIEMRNGEIFLTDEGLKALGDDFEPLPTGEALRRHWLDKLPAGESLILSLVMNAYPNSIGREQLSDETGYKRSSRDAYLQRLATRKLIVADGRGSVSASDNLFKE